VDFFAQWWFLMQAWTALRAAIRDRRRRRFQELVLNEPVWLPELLSSPRRNYLTCTTVIKNDARYLDEWLQFHLLMGVEHFYIYENGSTDHSLSILLPYQEAGFVTLVPWHHFSVWANTQRLANAHAIANFGMSTTWMAFFDVDEFVLPTDASSLTAILKEREHLHGIGVAGINFGTNGHRAIPGGLVTENFCQAVPMMAQRNHDDLLNVKSIVQPGCVSSIESAHWFNYRDSSDVGYNEDGEPLVRYPRRQPQKLKTDVIRYNHYYTRSLEEFSAKVNGSNVRGAQLGVPAEKRWASFRKIEELGVRDDTIQRFLPALKAKIVAWQNTGPIRVSS
jgi:hypothetical protein